MRVALTGTPGTGKTTAIDAIETDIDIIHLNEVIREQSLISGQDEERDTLVADLDAVRDWLGDRDDILIESHLAHHLPVDYVIVLRCHPSEIEDRLANRGESDTTLKENAESEALDVILTEAVGIHGEDAVYEIETTDKSPAATARKIEDVLRGDREPSAGTVSYLDFL